MVQLIVSIDVEEEGLFSGAYPRTPTVQNLRHLDKLAFLSDRHGLPLTLLTSYAVASDPAARDVLRRWQQERGAEIGAHLHPWSTPPFADLGLPEPVRSDALPPELLRAKFETLLTTLERNFGQRPLSFRMGRWDFGHQVERLLPELGFLVDSSVAPLRHAPGGPDRFLCPPDPYWLPGRGPQGQRVLEVPITVVPLWPGLARLTHALARRLPPKQGERLLARFKGVAALGIQPVWYPAPSMRWGARLHLARGGRVLCLFFHSSELMPGQSPQFPDEAAVQALLRKLDRFVQELRSRTEVRGLRLSEAAALLGPDAPEAPRI